MDPPVIFVVDDDESVRNAIRRLLHSLHFQVHTFASAEQFLAVTKTGAPGCLILDQRLPGMNAVQLQEHLCSLQWKLPTIIITAHDEDALRDQSLRLGAIAYLQKPFDNKVLLASVQQALGDDGI